MRAWKAEKTTPMDQAVPCVYNLNGWGVGRCPGILATTRCPHLTRKCHAILGKKKEADAFTAKLDKTFTEQSKMQWEVDNNKGGDKKKLAKVRAINQVKSVKANHFGCELKRLSNTLALKNDPSCPWDENQYKWNMTAAENCGEQKYKIACEWLTSEAGTP